MGISQKCQYALRAVFELAKRPNGVPTKTGQIAEAQAIPPRFLELILGELKQGGFVESRRGMRGGYMLIGEPADLAVGRIIRFVEGPLAPVACVADTGGADCPLHGTCAFLNLWRRARDAVAHVYDTTTFQDLIDQHQAAKPYVPSYTI